ncbi:hypothetical protein AYI69_g11142 [Smittium culicis]|uniref:Uncharacterized protein n=1 Tax=Smittium culicis TaxID=133412 RepID=A0A1R1X0W7_9FUNG|nr:hypothetical protein AYI69_g11142 [Smittium culicis]
MSTDRSEADVKIIDIWINRFNTAVALKSHAKQKAIDIFKLWTEGLATKRQNDMETISNTFECTLEVWLDKLKSKFVKKTDQKVSIFALLNFIKVISEDIDTFNNRFRKYVLPTGLVTDKSTNAEKKVMVAIKSEKAKNVPYGGLKPKRPRLDNILNPIAVTRPMFRNTIVNLTRLGTVKKSQKMKRANFVKKKETGLLYAKGPAQERDSDSSEESEKESGDEDDDLLPLSYLTIYVNKEPIPLFLDPEAAYSIISTELLKSLNLNAGDLKVPIKIKPVSGKVVEIRKGVELPIEFDDGSYYRNSVYSAQGMCGAHLIGPRCVKAMLPEEFGANSTIDSGEVEESVLLLYASIESEISEAAYLDPLFVESSSKLGYKVEIEKKN